MSVWIAIGVTAVGCYAVKLLGLLVPAGALERPLVQRLVLDARAAGVAAAAVALLLRAPFLLVVAAAVVVTAGVRAMGG